MPCVPTQGGNAIMLGTVNDRTTNTPPSAVVLAVFAQTVARPETPTPVIVVSLRR